MLITLAPGISVVIEMNIPCPVIASVLQTCIGYGKLASVGYLYHSTPQSHTNIIIIYLCVSLGLHVPRGALTVMKNIKMFVLSLRNVFVAFVKKNYLIIRKSWFPWKMIEKKLITLKNQS
jgi:hypothetical protein